MLPGKPVEGDVAGQRGPALWVGAFVQFCGTMPAFPTPRLQSLLHCERLAPRALRPAAALACQPCRLPPALLFPTCEQALMSNIGGAATMVGDPPALIIGGLRRLRCSSTRCAAPRRGTLGRALALLPCSDPHRVPQSSSADSGGAACVSPAGDVAAAPAAAAGAGASCSYGIDMT